MLVSKIAQLYAPQIQKMAGKAKPEAAEKPTSKGYNVKISKEGANLSKSGSSSEAAGARAAGMEDVRWDKVDEAKRKVAEGFYDTPQFKEDLASKLAGEFGAVA